MYAPGGVLRCVCFRCMQREAWGGYDAHWTHITNGSLASRPPRLTTSTPRIPHGAQGGESNLFFSLLPNPTAVEKSRKKLFRDFFPEKTRCDFFPEFFPRLFSSVNAAGSRACWYGKKSEKSPAPLLSFTLSLGKNPLPPTHPP